MPERAIGMPRFVARNRPKMRSMAPAANMVFPPRRCVRSQISSSESVHGVLIPM